MFGDVTILFDFFLSGAYRFRSLRVFFWLTLVRLSQTPIKKVS